jgi:hypothetical protein
MPYTDSQLQAIYDSIALPRHEPVRRSSPFDGATRKWLRVYKAPGYPTEPRLDAARALDGFLQPFAPNSPRTYDFEALARWIHGYSN